MEICKSLEDIKLFPRKYYFNNHVLWHPQSCVINISFTEQQYVSTGNLILLFIIALLSNQISALTTSIVDCRILNIN